MDWFDSVKKAKAGDEPYEDDFKPPPQTLSAVDSYYRDKVRREPYESDGETENKIYSLLNEMQKKGLETSRLINELFKVAEASNDETVKALVDEYNQEWVKSFRMIDAMMKRLKQRRQYT